MQVGTEGNPFPSCSPLGGRWCKALRRAAPLLIFVLAFAVRCFFNLAYTEHRISDIGDGYLYLLTGNKLLSAITTSHSLSDFASHVGMHSDAPLDTLLTSDRLADRLLLDGPVYPIYLCILQYLLKVPAGNLNYTPFAVPLSLVYSFTDSLTCLFIFFCARYAFNRKAAVLAGVFYALYPPAIINTSNSFSEPFAAFCLMLFACQVLPLGLKRFGKKSPSLVRWLLAGSAAGIVMLVRSAFAVIPVGVAVLFAGLLFLRARQLGGANGSINTRRLIAGILAAICGTLVVLSPYFAFTKWQIGKFSLVSRAPGYNICMGNQLESDGWISYSPQFMTSDAKVAVDHVLTDASTHKAAFASLLLRKVMRLWGGAWNDFQLRCLLNAGGIDVLHQLLLLSAAIGFIWLWKAESHKRSRVFCLGLTLSSFWLIHFIYVLFIAMSRYAFTAVPAMLVLSGYAWAVLSARPYRKRFFAIVGFGLLAFALNKTQGSLIPLVLSVTGSVAMAMWMNALVWSGLWIAIAVMLLRIDREAKFGKPALALTGVVTALAMGVTIASCLGNQSAYEWKTKLKAKQSISREIKLGAIVPGQGCWLMIDAQSSGVTPSFAVSINGQPVNSVWVPWLATRTAAEAQRFVEVLAVQAHATGKPVASFRQWWVYPLPASLLKADATNSVVLTSQYDGDTIFGDYGQNGTRRVPSIYDFSWLKGFAAMDRGDTRFCNTNASFDSTASKWFDGTNWRSDDLSNNFGKQCGDFRIFMATSDTPLRDSPIAQEQIERCPIITSKDEKQVLGVNPLSFSLASHVAIPRLCDSVSSDAVVLEINCDLKSNRKRGYGSVVCCFNSNTSANGSSAQTVSWQPESIPVSDRWKHVTITEVLPRDCWSRGNAFVDVVTSPFQPDLLFLRRNEAVKRKLLVRNFDASLVRVPMVIPNAVRWNLN